MFSKSIKVINIIIYIKQASRDFLHQMVGPGTFEKWIKWRYPSAEQQLRAAVKSEIESILNNSEVIIN